MTVTDVIVHPGRPGGRPCYDEAMAALQAAHDACLNHPDRDVLGMSHGPFSGVNVALGIVLRLEAECAVLRAEVAQLRAARK